MSSVISSIDEDFLAAQSLTNPQKLELISRLWDDVRVGGEFRPSASDVAEIRRRSAELDAGSVTPVPWELVQDSVRRRLKSNDSA